jgi:hypothetical protein
MEARTLDGALFQSAISRSPVLVVGPGCHRIGFDRAPEWSRVVHRMRRVWSLLETPEEKRFLERFWTAQLSDERRVPYPGEGDALPAELEGLGIRESDPVPDYGDNDSDALGALRAALAADLTRALVASTRCLGHVISSADAPVSEWQAVSHEWETGRDKHRRAELVEDARFRDDLDDLPGLAETHDASAVSARDRAIVHVWMACRLADAINELASYLAAGAVAGWVEEHSDLLTKHGLPEADIDGLVSSPPDPIEFKREADRLKIGDIASSLAQLLKHGIIDGTRVRLSGAVVEWLSDLLWHVVQVGAEVPPSQDELAFYVNLQTVRDADVTQRLFTRAIPGDYRRTDAESLMDDLVRLLEGYDSGVHDDPRWNDERQRFFVALAAILVTTWRHEMKESIPRLVVALVSDYDLLLERAVLKALGPGEHFHVVVPVWVGAPADLDWLFGTYTREGGSIGEVEIARPKWEFYAKQPLLVGRDDRHGRPSAGVRGPIIVKLGGSPLHMLHQRDVNHRSSTTLGGAGIPLEWRSVESTSIRLAPIFSEYDAMNAIVSLAKIAAAPGDRMLPQQLVETGLTWDGRSWLFFGHRLSDWLPRLRLFFTRHNVHAPSGSDRKRVEQGGAKADQESVDVKPPPDVPNPKRVAVDRSFDWPELALLNVLEIDPRTANMAAVGDFATEEPKPNAYNRDFLIDVGRIVRSICGSAAVGARP